MLFDSATDAPTHDIDEALATPTNWEGIPLSLCHVIRRNGQLTSFDANKIAVAMTKAFLAVEGESAKESDRIRLLVQQLTNQVIKGVSRRLKDNGIVHIEDIQDQVELALMREEQHKVARAYVIYREQHAKQREALTEATILYTTDYAGQSHILDESRLRVLIKEACENLEGVDPHAVLSESLRNIFDGISDAEVNHALVMSARALNEKEPNYSYVAARLLLDKLRSEAFNTLNFKVKLATATEMSEYYPDYFTTLIEYGIECELLTPQLLEFDLDKLSKALVGERDLLINYLGLQTLYDRYFLHHQENRFELPQAFFMRVAMGLALNETDKTAWAIEFYNLLSCFDLMCSTPTLFNSGTRFPQLSSCFVSTIPDDLESIFNSIRDNALMQKWAGGIGNDWTYVRGAGALIKGTNGKSQGVVPFMKVANDTLVSVNQGGRRRGSGCAYLETWHIDIEEFLELRKNTGDERRRTHDMNSGNWIPDLFMERVMKNQEWMLFSPDETPDLHDLYGEAFKQSYLRYESLANQGQLRLFKRITAVSLWRKMLTMLFETGHPWILFKDAFNVRNPQQHIGAIHSSNLCTEIGLNTSKEEVAVCNLASINLAQHVKDHQLDEEKLKKTITTAMRMLDNVIDINYYSIPQARTANLRHRPVGLGIMGFQDVLYQLKLPYASEKAVEFADKSMEIISYYAILASSQLAEERGSYSSYEGSLWNQGILPIDSLNKLSEIRSDYLEVSRQTTLDWGNLRERIKIKGMRNSNCMAIAPTATISNICGVSQSIEPTYQNLFIKSNLSGEFTVINPYLVKDLKKLGLWDEVMVNDLKFYDGSLAQIKRIPKEMRRLYATAFEIDSSWLIEAAARRQKWIDQSQSLNIYVAESSGRKMDALYKLAWLRGLKSTYYLRTTGASQVEKLTVNQGMQQACSIDNQDCEVCQ